MSSESTPTRPRQFWWYLLAAGTLALGLFFGYIVGRGGRTVQETGSGPVAYSTPAAPASGASTASTAATVPDQPVAAGASVNAACLRVINEAQSVHVILSGLDEAARQNDFRELDNIVRRLQPIQPLLQRDLAECQIDTTVAQGQEVSPPPTPSVTAPASVSSTSATPATPVGTATPASPTP